MTPNCALPANYLTSGKILRVTIHLRLTTGAAPPALSYRLLAGATILSEVTPGTPGTVTNFQDGHQYIIQATAAPSASSAVEATPCCQMNALSATSTSSNVAMPVNLATNGALTIQFATQWSAAGTGTNQVKLSQFIVEALN